MKEQYIVPELEIVTFVPVEQLAAGYLGGYARSIGAGMTKGGTASDPDVDVDVPIPGAGGEGNP